MKLLKISSDGRRIEREDGQSIYLIGDTAWELFHKLNADEARFYLETRKRQGFNLIQAVVLAELDGLDRPNAYGRVPLKRNSYGNFDPCLPDTEGDYSYFDHVEAVLNMAEEMGLYVGLLPTWGDKYNLKWGKGPVIFTPENAYVYGRWLAERFIHHSNIIWILGGDRPMESEQHIAVNDGLAKGVREGDGGKFLITLHPCGCQSSSMNFHLRDWLDFNMIQSGHSYPLPAPSYEMLARDRAMHPIKPVMDGEQLYEDHAKNFKEKNGFFDAVDVRVTMYRNLFSGTCGNTYGHSSVWCMCDSVTPYWPNTWREALTRPAAEQMHIFADFVSELPLAALEPIANAVKNNEKDENYVSAMVGADRAYLYIPNGIPVRLELSAIPFTPVSVKVFEPSEGTWWDGAELTADGALKFKGRGAGRGMDAVLLLLP